jgi:hypothetical protein
MIEKIDVKQITGMGVTSLAGKINEIVDNMNTILDEKDKIIATLGEEIAAKDVVLEKLSAELTSIRSEANLTEKEPVIAVEPKVEEKI